MKKFTTLSNEMCTFPLAEKKYRNYVKIKFNFQKQK